MSADAMTKRDWVMFKIDPARLPPLAAADRDALQALAALPDSSIDTSDIPPLTDAHFAKARRNPLLCGQHAVMVHLDDDILAWLGPNAEDRDAKLASILRDAMKKETAAHRR